MSEPMKSAILRAENTAVARVKNRARLDAWNHVNHLVAMLAIRRVENRVLIRVWIPINRVGNRVRERVRDV